METRRIFKSLVGEIQVDYKFKSRPKVKIKTSEDAYKEIRSLFKRINYKEEVYMLLLNRAGNSLGWVKVSEGGIAGTVMDVKIILQHALLAHASSVILAHNHPSGNLTPSGKDLNTTNRIKKACELLEVSLIDHLIITDDSYYSMADEGCL